MGRDYIQGALMGLLAQKFGQIVDLFDAEGAYYAKVCDLRGEKAYLAILGYKKPAFGFGDLVKFQSDANEATRLKLIHRENLPEGVLPLIIPPV